MSCIKQIIEAPKDYYCVYEMEEAACSKTEALQVYFMALLSDDCIYPMTIDGNTFSIEDGSTSNYIGLFHKSKLLELGVTKIE